MELTPTISLNIWTADGVTVDPVPAHQHVAVNLGDHVRVFSTDPDVLEQVARAFWDAAARARAKQGPDPEVAKTLALTNGGGA